MKSKNKYQLFEASRLVKRYHYLKAKLPPNAKGDSIQMKYIKYHLNKRGVKI